MSKKQHHGGAWKIAYADFMTAMMAFFLLLWLLSFSDEDKLTGIANYFKPADIALTNLGGQGVMGGTSSSEDDLLGESVPSAEAQQMENSDLSAPGEKDSEEAPQEHQNAPSADAGAGAENPWAKLVKKDNEMSPVGSVSPIVSNIKERLSPFADSVRVHEKNGNIVIDVIDLNKAPMFVSGSAELTEANLAIAKEIAGIIGSTGGTIIITGHTDSLPYRRQDGYGNWELSADRANAVRRAMVSMGVEPGRIVRVSGVADTSPLDGEAVDAPENRRVSIEIGTGV